MSKYKKKTVLVEGYSVMEDYILDDVDLQMQKDFNDSAAKAAGVKYPLVGLTARYLTLKYFYINMNKIVNVSSILLYIRNYFPNKADNQSRQLGKGVGFHILQGRIGDVFEGKKFKSGEYVFTGFGSVHPYWTQQRRNTFNGDFEKIKESHGNVCATCGTKEGTAHRAQGGNIILEKGHMDPSKPLEEGNIIPHCNFCNKEYGSKFIFTSKGAVKEPTKEFAAIIALKTQESKEVLLEELLKDPKEAIAFAKAIVNGVTREKQITI